MKRPTKVPHADERTERVQSLVKGLSVLQAFNRTRAAMTLSQVAQATKLPRATARRLLHTLVELGHVESDRNQFRLTAKVLDLGYAYLASLPWWEIATPYMQDIVDRFDETCTASVLSGSEVAVVARLASSRITAINIPPGSRLPAHATAMGRILLASRPAQFVDRYVASARLRRFTPRTITDPTELRRAIDLARQRGFSIADQELEADLRAIAVPLTDRSGGVVAALAIATHASRASVRHLEQEFLPALKQAAQKIGTAIPLTAGGIRSDAVGRRRNIDQRNSKRGI